MTETVDQAIEPRFAAEAVEPAECARPHREGVAAKTRSGARKRESAFSRQNASFETPQGRRVNRVLLVPERHAVGVEGRIEREDRVAKAVTLRLTDLRDIPSHAVGHLYLPLERPQRTTNRIEPVWLTVVNADAR
jgi:hypothetical protein